MQETDECTFIDEYFGQTCKYIFFFNYYCKVLLLMDYLSQQFQRIKFQNKHFLEEKTKKKGFFQKRGEKNEQKVGGAELEDRRDSIYTRVEAMASKIDRN